MAKGDRQKRVTQSRRSVYGASKSFRSPYRFLKSARPQGGRIETGGRSDDRVIRFGECSYDPQARELRRGGKRTELTPRSLDLLGLLLAARPRVVTKTELRDRLWPATAVADSSLPKLVTELRHGIGDDARKPRFIRTVHRHGYAFCGPAHSDARSSPSVEGHRWCLLKGDDAIGLVDGENLIGRAVDCLVRIESARVSRHHARIRVAADQAVLQDLGSKNGTFLQGQRLSAAATLAEGDEIRVGAVVLVFSGVNASASTMTE